MDRVLRATCVAIVIFATVIAFIVGSRIDQNTISLLSGTMIGILIAAPSAAIITFVMVRRRESSSLSSYDRGIRHSTPLPQNPPQYWVLPQQYAGANAPAYIQGSATHTGAPGWPGAPDEMSYLPRPRRRFYVIGENGEARMLENPAAAPDAVTAPYELDGDDADAGGVF
jgi:hypothetical protein